MKIEKKDLGFLGADYQYRLVSAYMSDHKFFNDTCSVIEQNAFTEPCLRSIMGIILDYYHMYESVPSYEMLMIKIGEKLIHNDEDKQYYEETLEKLKRTSIDGREEVENLGLKFFKQQELIRISHEITEDVGRGASMDELSKYEKEITDVFAVKRGNENISHPFDDVDNDLSGLNTTFIPTGISKLDEILGGGLEKGKMGIIIGPTGFGKTSMATCIAANAATCLKEDNDYEGYKVLQIVFEDSHRDIHRKYISKVSQIETADLNKDEETPDVVREILRNSEDRERINNNVEIMTLKTGEYSATDIKNEIKKRINEGFKPDMVVIDYFECVAPEAGMSKLDVTERESKTMRKFENMAPELNIALWIPTQGNRDSLVSEIVTTDKMGGSIKKGQISQVIVSISKTVEQKKQNRATISLLKNRSGKDTVNLEGVYFNNGTCTIDCSEVVEFEDVLEYNEYATEKEKAIERNMIKEARANFKLNQK